MTLHSNSIVLESAFTYTQSELFYLLKSRDENGFEYLYDRYAGALLNVILAIVSNREDGEDVLQETFAKIWRNIDRYDESRGRLFTWMHKIARNTAIDALRTKGYEQRSQAITLEETDALLPVVQSSSTIWDDVDRLEKKYSVLLKMSYFQGYTQKEIALMLGIPLSTVKHRLQMALKELGNIILTILLIFMF